MDSSANTMLASSAADIQTYVSGDLARESGPRPRPVADAPIDALLAQADEMARRWAIALIFARPLQGIGELPLEDIAREAPALCAQIVRALASDAELEPLARAPAEAADGWPAGTLAALAGAPDAQAAVAASEALRGVLWEELLGELRCRSFDWSGARQVADLSDRLAYVCATALTASLARERAKARGQSPTPADGGREAVVYSAERSPRGRRGITVVDEREEVSATAGPADRREPGQARRVPPLDPARARRAPSPAQRAPGERGDERRPAADQERVRPRPRPWDIPLDERSQARKSPRSEESRPDAWIADTSVEGDDRVLRITRRTVAPADEPA
jgi:hypothetical protein